MLAASSTSDAHDSASPEEGQATVEFALILPVLCLILFAVVQFGMAFWTYQQISAAASEGARRAAVSRTASDRVQRAITAAEESAPNLDADSMDVSVASTWAAGSTVTVTVNYPQEISVMGIEFFDSNLVGRRTMRVEQ